MNAKLLKSSWLSRTVLIPVGDQDMELSYSAWTLGGGRVSIGNLGSWGDSNFWFSDEIEISKAEDQFVVRVRVRPWLSIESFQIVANGESIFLEGPQPSASSLFERFIRFAAYFVILNTTLVSIAIILTRLLR